MDCNYMTICILVGTSMFWAYGIYISIIRTWLFSSFLFCCCFIHFLLTSYTYMCLIEQTFCGNVDLSSTYHNFRWHQVPAAPVNDVHRGVALAANVTNVANLRSIRKIIWNGRLDRAAVVVKRNKKQVALEDRRVLFIFFDHKFRIQFFLSIKCIWA